MDRTRRRALTKTERRVERIKRKGSVLCFTIKEVRDLADALKAEGIEITADYIMIGGYWTVRAGK